MTTAASTVGLRVSIFWIFETASSRLWLNANSKENNGLLVFVMNRDVAYVYRFGSDASVNVLDAGAERRTDLPIKLPAFLLLGLHGINEGMVDSVYTGVVT